MTSTASKGGGIPDNRQAAISPGKRRWFGWALLLALALFALQNSLFRPLWYDEALTILEFVGQDSLSFLYWNYPIPNNHIAYNLLLLIWAWTTQAFLPLGDLSFRLFGFVQAVASLLLMSACWRRRTGWLAAVLAAACLALAPAFPIYGVGVRGYQLSFLAVLLALESGRRWRDGGRRWLGIAYFAACLLAVGTMPTNLLALAAIPLLPDRPLAPENIFQPRRLWLLFAPALAFVVFYLPIGGQLLGVMALKEGWPGFAGAALHFYAAFGLMALPLLAMAVPGLFAWRRRRTPWALLCGVGVFLLPAAAMLARNPVPFPRAFYPFWPVWLYLLALGFQAGQAALRRRSGPGRGRILPWACLLLLAGSALGIHSGAEWVSGRLTPAGAQDDYFRPYFMRHDFHPFETMEKAVVLTGGLPGQVFIDAGADPFSLLYYSRIRRGGALPEGFWLLDPPGKPPLTFAAPPPHLFLVVRDEARAKSLAERFGLAKCHRVADCGFHRIYLAEGQPGESAERGARKVDETNAE
jgi:hypothetical protein